MDIKRIRQMYTLTEKYLNRRAFLIDLDKDIVNLIQCDSIFDSFNYNELYTLLKQGSCRWINKDKGFKIELKLLIYSYEKREIEVIVINVQLL